jgi:hypothetical protein
MPKTRKRQNRAKANWRIKSVRRRMRHEERHRQKNGNTWTKDVASFLPGDV